MIEHLHIYIQTLPALSISFVSAAAAHLCPNPKSNPQTRRKPWPQAKPGVHQPAASNLLPRCPRRTRWHLGVCQGEATNKQKQEKYKDTPMTAIDLFKECHCSSKSGFSEPVKIAIAEMEAIAAEPAQEGQPQKTPCEALSQVLPKTKFLSSVGLQSAAPKRSGKAAVEARVHELESELHAEKQGAADLRDTLDEQQLELHALKKQIEQSEDARKEQLEEIAALKKGQEETNMLLRRMLTLSTQPTSGV